jgi:uncharacterized protein
MRTAAWIGFAFLMMGCGPKEEDARAYLKEIGVTVTELKKDKDGDAFTFKGTKENDICTGTVSVKKSGGSTNSFHNMTCERDTSACKPGAADACIKIADELYAKDAKIFPTLAAQLYRTACGDKNAHACNRASEFEVIGKNWEKVREYGSKGCELSNAEACYRVGVTEMHGDGTPKNETKGRELFKKACDLGSNSGCISTAANLLDAEPKKIAEALPIAEKLCAAKDQEGCHLLGFALYYEKKNLPRAVEVLDGVCKGNGPKKAVANSCNIAGVIYLEEMKPKKDPARALKFFEAACEKESGDGCSNVGLLNEKGVGTPRNAERAKEAYAKACSLGKEKACAK